MTQIATVRKLTKLGFAEVEVRRQTACGHDCKDCAGCTQVVTGETVVLVNNDLNANLGDVVLIESQSSQVLTAAMIVYILPFLLFFVGYFACGALFSQPEGTVPVIGGLLGFALGLFSAIYWDRRERKKRNLQFRMVEIKQRCLGT